MLDKVFTRGRGFDIALFAVALFGACNHALGEEGNRTISAVSWWSGWWLSGIAALVILVLFAMALFISVWTLSSKNRTLENTVAHLKQNIAGLKESLRAAEQNAEEQQRNADVANQSRSVFLTSVSHELCTPLNGILGYASILRRSQNLDSFMVDGLDVILHSGQRLQSLIDDLLDGVRISTGQLELHPEPIQLNGFINHTKGLIQTETDAKGLELSASISDGVPGVVLADEARLRQVLLHLMGNAVKYTEEGYVALLVETLNSPGTKHGQVGLRFAVKNSGRGIDPDQFEKASLPFDNRNFDLDDSEFALMICHSIVLKMGGALHTEDREGVGSRVWFDVTLPVVTAPSHERPASVDRIVGYEGDRRKILIVDDKFHNRMLLKAMLEPLGFDILMGEDGREAVERTIEWCPDVILLDLVMPVTSGFEAVEAIREYPEGRDIVIIAVSASVSDTGKAQCLEAGCNAYLEKPIRLGKLLSLIGGLLEIAWIYEATGLEDSASLIAPPTEDLMVLYRLAEAGLVYEIQQVSAELEQRDSIYRPFCRKITELAKGFELDRISDIIEQYLAD